MGQLLFIVSGIVLLAIVVFAFGAYTGLRAAHRTPSAPPYLAGFLVWALGPVERRLDGRVSSTSIAVLALVLRALTGVLVSVDLLSASAWAFAASGLSAALAWRFAVDRGVTSRPRALFEAVAGRWGELFVFVGYAWQLHDSPWLGAVLAAFTGWTMVSYTQARAESLGLEFPVGASQHAERIVIVTLGTLLAAWMTDQTLVAPILGMTMVACAVTSIATAVYRGVAVYRLLLARDAP